MSVSWIPWGKKLLSNPAMADPNPVDKDNFLYPPSRYWGQFSHEHLIFNANLQEFAQRVTYVSALETGGKVSPVQAYTEIKHLWKQLKRSKKHLDIGGNTPPQEN